TRQIKSDHLTTIRHVVDHVHEGDLGDLAEYSDSKPALPVDDQGRWDRARRGVAGKCQAHFPRRIVDAGIGDLEAPNERLSRRRIVVLAGDANELGDVLCLDTRMLEIRCLLATRRTPGAPDVDHNDLAAIVLS